MNKGEAKKSNNSETISTEKMDRRDFFVTAGKVIIPTLGIIGLSLAIGGKVQAATCSGNCTGSCTGCKGGCWSCVGTCQETCEGISKGMVKSTSL